MEVQSAKIQLGPEDEAGAWADELREDALDALSVTQERLGLEIDQPPLLRSVFPERAFYDALGERPHNLVAVAMAGENRILINRRRFLSDSRSRRRAVLVHEFTHLILGRAAPGVLPRWMSEGLAMVTAREHSFQHHTRLVVAASFGGLLPLEELWGNRTGATDQELAYAESLSAVRYFLKSRVHSGLGIDADLAALAKRLADPSGGAALRSLLRDSRYLSAFEREWRASLKTFWTWVGALSTGGVLWFGVSSLFLVAYWRKKRIARQTEQRWKEEDEAFPYLE